MVEWKYQQLRNASSRFYAVNLQSSQPTIEVRLFRGTLKLTDLIASIELVDLLAHLAKELDTRQLRNITWKSIIKKAQQDHYLYLPQKLAQPKKAVQLRMQDLERTEVNV